jgi:DNA polymerase I
VGYVITLGTGKLYEKAKPYQLASKNELDIEYYISNQVIPATSRILEALGVNVERILSQKTTKTLMDYIKK